MQAIVAFCFGTFFLSSLAIGLRLIWLARRNRGLPELLIGVSILGIGPAGFAAMVFAMAFGPGRPLLATALLVLAQLCIAIGSLSAYVFNWRVFRPDSASARAFVYAAGAVYVAVLAGRTANGSYSLPMRTEFWTLVSSFDMIACMLWGSFESLHYHARMRRRERLGLADPVLTNRFLLWGLGIGSAGVGSLISNVVMMLTGRALTDFDALTLSNSLFGLTAAVLMWVAFLPPAAYRRWVEDRARRRGVLASA